MSGSINLTENAVPEYRGSLQVVIMINLESMSREEGVQGFNMVSSLMLRLHLMMT